MKQPRLHLVVRPHLLDTAARRRGGQRRRPRDDRRTDGTKTTSVGVLRVRKPGAMVWDYAQTDSPDSCLDGTTARVVDRDSKQVIELNVEDSDFAGATKFLFGGRQILDDFLVRMSSKELVARYGTPGHSIVDMQPRIANPHYQQLLLVIDDATGRVDAFVVFNTDGSTNHFALGGFKRDAGLTDEQIEFRRTQGLQDHRGLVRDAMRPSDARFVAGLLETAMLTRPRAG